MLYVVFLAVYVGMLLGGIPGLTLDRTGVALLGAIAVVAGGYLSPQQAWDAIDIPTLGLLFGLMVVSAQFQLSGFYDRFTLWLAGLSVSPPRLLAIVVAFAGLLSALLCNDVICLAMAPVLAAGCLRRRLNPLPFLLALACAANVGSAGTLIGNPQVMLIGQVLALDFARYLWQAAVPAVLGLAAVWAIIAALYRSRWQLEVPDPAQERLGPSGPATETTYSRWQTAKGFLVFGLLIVAFTVGHWPREVLALAAAGLLLVSRKMNTREMLAEVDWHLLVLFMGLFVVNGSLMQSSEWHQITTRVEAAGIDPHQPEALFGLSVVLSNLVSNVPAVMLLLPFVSTAAPHYDGTLLALSSTFAGNLLIVGSIANIIVVEQARMLGIHITWREHGRVGVAVTLVTLALAAAWLYLLATWV